MATLRNKDMVKLIKDDTGLTAKDIKAVLASLKANIHAEVAFGNRIVLTDLAAFDSVITKPTKEHYNALLGRNVSYPSYRRVAIKPAAKLKAFVRGGQS